MLNGHRSMPSPSPQAISHHVHMRNVRVGAADKNMASSLFSALKGGFGPCVIEIACFWTATIILCDTSTLKHHISRKWPHQPDFDARKARSCVFPLRSHFTSSHSGHYGCITAIGAGRGSCKSCKTRNS